MNGGTMNLKNSYIGGVRRDADFLRVSGNDALRFMQGMWTADMKLAAAHAPSSLGAYLLDLKAKPISPAQILCLSGNEFYLMLPKGRGQAVCEALDRYLVADDVELKLFETQAAPFQVLEVFENPFIDSNPEGVEAFRVKAPIALDKSRVFGAIREETENAYVLPVGELNNSNYQVWYEASSQIPPYVALRESQLHELYVKAGRPIWDRDYGPESLILEFPYHSKISFYKGCYIGQEVVARATYRGQIAKAFARFHCSEQAQEGFVFRKNEREKPVGKVTTVSQNMATGQLRLRDYQSHDHVIVSSDNSKEIAITQIDILCVQEEDTE